MKILTEALPEPCPAESQHVKRVDKYLRDTIEKQAGRIPFSRFMDIALFAPELGYYAAGAWKFGAGGDFVTAPELGSLFGRCLARQCAEVLTVIGGGSILEFGAGSGVLCVQILRALSDSGCLPDCYMILEPSPELRQRQRDVIALLPDALAERVIWVEHPPEAGLKGVILANEVLDAMPVERFRVCEPGYERFYVGAGETGFDWRGQLVTDPDDPVCRLIQTYKLTPGYVSECSLQGRAWAGQLAEWLEYGVAFLIDYGYSGEEYYHPQRRSGTLCCHFHHHVHDDPLILTGVQDITSHVDFSALAMAASLAGLDVLGFCNQASFLMDSGLMFELAESSRPVQQQLNLSSEIKRLTLPSEMGEVFKVIAFGRGMDESPSGFAGGNRAGQLLQEVRV